MIVLKDNFEVASGSIVGNDHRWSGRNNQDAHHCVVEPSVIVGVVCDGCGSCNHSEVGSQIGAKLIVEETLKLVTRFSMESHPENTPEVALWNRFWFKVMKHVTDNVIAHLRVLSLSMGSSLSSVVQEYFLFTIVGFVLTPARVVLFSIGDGVLEVNSKVKVLGPFPNNQPPYLAYCGLVESTLAEKNSELLSVQINDVRNTEEVNSILVGSDGVVDFIKSQDMKMPGKNEKVGPLSQFWEDDRYFKNPDMIRRKLSLVNREFTSPDWQEQRIVRENGLLSDDTTMIVVRRKK
ncbi:MAG: protein phosphatase 2C domain-containing protein [archaeon]